MATMMLLKVADSLMPRTSRMVMIADDHHGRDVEHGAGAGPAFGEQAPDVPPGVRGRGMVVRREVKAGGITIPRSLQEGDDVARPADGDGGGGKQILENQVPADDPGDEFAQRGVAVSVGRPGDGDHGRELGVAQAGKGASQSRQHEGKDNRRPGVLRRRLAGEHENARANDCPDAQSGQVQRPQRSFEAVVASGSRLAGRRHFFRRNKFMGGRSAGQLIVGQVNG